MKGLLLADLDGTIRKPIFGEHITNPENQVPIAGAQEALNYYRSEGYAIAGVTNQGGVENNTYKTLESCILEQQYTLQLFPQIDCIYFCPDKDLSDIHYIKVTKTGHSQYLTDFTYAPHYLGGFRKPHSGMLRLAVNEIIGLELISSGIAPVNSFDYRETHNLYQLRNEFDDNISIALREYDVVMTGDRDIDMIAANSFGIRFIRAEEFRLISTQPIETYA